MREAPPALTERFLAAFTLASRLHGGRRLGTEIPYMAHLLVVTGLVLEDGGSETEAIAALLHDSVEDGGGRPLLAQIEREFGPRVAMIVAACSDSLDPEDGRPWRARKADYLAHLPSVTDEAVLRVVLADKVHNARSIVRIYRNEGHALWERFTNKTADEQLWYYGELLAFFSARHSGPLVEDLRRAVEELTELVVADPDEADAAASARRRSARLTGAAGERAPGAGRGGAGRAGARAGARESLA
jgi:HD domain-containing protein